MDLRIPLTIGKMARIENVICDIGSKFKVNYNYWIENSFEEASYGTLK